MEKKKTDYKQMNTKNLTQELDKVNKKLSKLYKDQMLGKLDNYYKIVRLKKDIARVKTLISLKKVLKEAGS